MAHKSNNGIEYYLGLEYPYTVVADEDEFFVQFPDLPGCMTQVERAEDIHTTAQEIKELWLETALEAGQRIPEPMSENFSGKFIARIPKSLHRDLAIQAREEGLSLNSYVVYLLAQRSLLTSAGRGVDAVMKRQTSPVQQSDEQVTKKDKRALRARRNQMAAIHKIQVVRKSVVQDRRRSKQAV